MPPKVMPARAAQFSGVDRVLHFGSERDKTSVPAELDAFSEQLFGHAVAVNVAAQEGENVLLLKIPCYLEGLFIAVGGADDARRIPASNRPRAGRRGFEGLYRR